MEEDAKRDHMFDPIKVGEEDMYKFLTGEDWVKRCVMCNRRNWRRDVNGRGEVHYVQGKGHYLRYIYDKEDKDYCCNECYNIIRRVVHNNGFYDDLIMPKGDDWIKETEKFEASLDHSWTEKDIVKILDEEKV